MTYASTYAAYRFIKKNRQLKKRQLNRLAFRVLFDKTSLIYLAFFGLMFSFWLSEQLLGMAAIFVHIEGLLWQQYFPILLLGVLRALASAFTRPGVLFSSSDLFLSLLPYNHQKLWQYHLVDKLIRAFVVYFAIGLIAKIITPLSYTIIGALIISFWMIHLLMVIPQWLLFQKKWYIKWLVNLGVGLLVIGMNIAVFMVDLNVKILIASLVFIFLLVINYWGYRQLFNFTDWSTIIETNDRVLSKNLLISFASKVKVEPAKPRGFYHHIIRNKGLRKPFKDHKKYQSYHRIIFFKLIEQKEQIIKATFGLIILLVLLSIQSQALYGWAIIIVLFLYAQIGTSFFPIIFEGKLLFSLPWRLEKWRDAFSRWLAIGFILLMILVAIPQFYWSDAHYWSVIHLISYTLIGHVLYNDRLNLHIKALMQKQVLMPVSFLVSFFILLFGVIYSVRFLNVSILVIIYSIVRYTYKYIKN